MFPGFSENTLALDGIDIYHRVGGNGPPLLLLHGYPQTHAMWHKVTPELAKHFTVVVADLRGYGASATPPSDAYHANYSKRAMARDMVNLMQALGHDRFAIMAHDRGGRVAHRLAADHPDCVSRMTILDIAPTREMYANTDDAFARAYWHWFYLIQNAPMPEEMIGADPRSYWLRKCGDGKAGLAPFDPQVLEHYLQTFENPEVIRASCEDYRAAATIDIQHDNEDDDKKLTCPLQILWGADGVIEACFDALALWRLRAENVTGQALPAGHYIAEEIPAILLDHALPFLKEAS